ncbi:uncharacterized protein LOC110019234 [Phalaenopsis equestris]|uniref:uncharacterized protein LOC110019234 n=1 Tax=Phalaenopsis equestris TaxID=78828 RepID=UPI0009E54F06|nr:uncharacterized protein LOC110019234 [Phalaenopsis equestris]
MTGSGIFGADYEDDVSESGSSVSNPTSRTSVRIYQQVTSGISQISFSAEEGVSPKKPTSIPEVAKQRELSGTLESEADAKVKKQLSDAKNKELSGHDIFGPPPENPPRPLAARNLELKGQLDFGEPAPRSIHTSVKVSNVSIMIILFYFINKAYMILGSIVCTSKKIIACFLLGIRYEAPPAWGEKPLSSAKLKEMSGSDIFADVKTAPRDYFGGVRKPPGGGSSIALL